MAKTILIYPPFCTPASPPYSITNIYAFLRNNLPKSQELGVLDLNIEFHRIKFSEYMQFCKTIGKDYSREVYEKKTNEYMQLTERAYSQNNRKVVNDQDPELLDDMFEKIIAQKPDIAAFSIVYSSQAFYAYALLKKLKQHKIRTVIGGPAVNSKLCSIADACLKNEIELLEFMLQKKIEHDKLKPGAILDFSIFDLEEYFTPEPVLPIRTSSSCYYRQCAFCSHHSNAEYFEFDINRIIESIKMSGQKNIFIVDDMVHRKRLLEIADKIKPLDVSWMCQLRPTKDFDLKTLKTLRQSGLKIILWGVESGSDRVLNCMRKGTNSKDAEAVLKNAKDAGITNVVFIMFGFPSETKEEFLETIDFLKKNKDCIDLVSTSVFGLQKGTPAYNDPKSFGIAEIKEEKRTILEPKISYTVESGLSQEQANYLRDHHIRTLESINKFPRSMNFFREHLICMVK